ncbi:hypothetical protein AB0D42_27725 [Streptomyces sp. NPDC048304]|uniref:hypothetical protein n=1 Tax=Streptomyces sp. NPDC048304 TaxID=3154820 RepID=UPI0033C1C385
MPEILPDLTDKSRCISVHWNLPVQCVLPRSHRENWHEAWHPQTGNRLRYRRSGEYRTEELHHGEWHDLEIPPPGGFCNDNSTYPNVHCTGQYGHGWNHRAVVDGCTYSWNTPVPRDLTVDQLTQDVKQLRGMLVAAHSRIAELEADCANVRTEALAEAKSEVVDWLVKKAHEGTEVARLADKVERGAIRIFFDAERSAAAVAPQHYDKVPDPADGCHWCACGNRWPCKHAKAVAR